MHKARKVKISGKMLNLCREDKFYTKVVAAMLIIKIHYINSAIQNFTIDKLQGLLHCNRATTKAILQYMLDNDLAEYRFTKDLRMDLYVAQLSTYTERTRHKFKAAYVNACATGSGYHFYIASGSQDNAKVLSKDNKPHTLSNVTDVIERLILLQTIHRINRSHCDTDKTETSVMCDVKRLRHHIEKAKSQHSKAKTPAEIMNSINSHYLDSQPKLRQIIHKMYDNTSGHEFSMYCPHSITMEKLTELAFKGSRSLKEVKRLMAYCIKVEKTLASHRHGRRIIYTGRDGSGYATAYKNVLGETCPAYISKTTKFIYNKKNTDQIESDLSLACHTAFVQPWPNTYELFTADVDVWVRG